MEKKFQSSECITEFFTIKSPNGNIYKQLNFSGSGSFGKVFKVSTQYKQIYAMKMIDMSKIHQTKEIEYVITEQEIMRCVNSPHILKIHDQFLFKNDYILITDFCEGGDLNKIMRDQYPLGVPEEQALNFLKQILEGFAELHRLKIIHRDLKLSNLLFHKECVVIADFGLAKIGVNSTNSIVGSLPFMAPEILVLPTLSNSSSIAYTSQVDVWSIGVCFYNILTGQLPYPNPNKSTHLQNIKRFSGKNLPINGVKLSENTCSLLQLMLEMNPDERISFPTLFDIFEINYQEPLESTDALMQIENSIFLSTQSTTVQTDEEISETNLNSKNNSELKIKLENENDSKSEEQSHVYLDILIGLNEENKFFVFEITFTINMIIFYMSVSKEITKLKNDLDSSFAEFKSEIDGLDFILFRKAYIYLCEIKNLLEDKPSIFNVKFPHSLFETDDLQRYDMLLFSIMNKLSLFFSQKKTAKTGRAEIPSSLICFQNMNFEEIDEFIKSKIRNCWFSYLQTENNIANENKRIILKGIYLMMHTVHFQEYFGVTYKKKPSMFVNFHKDIKTKSLMSLKSWIQLAFVIHNKNFDFFK